VNKWKFPPYEKIRIYLATTYHIYISPCEIASAKQQLGYKVKKAWNRFHPKRRTKECDKRKLSMVREAVSYYCKRRKREFREPLE